MSFWTIQSSFLPASGTRKNYCTVIIRYAPKGPNSLTLAPYLYIKWSTDFNVQYIYSDILLLLGFGIFEYLKFCSHVIKERRRRQTRAPSSKEIGKINQNVACYNSQKSVKVDNFRDVTKTKNPRTTGSNRRRSVSKDRQLVRRNAKGNEKTLPVSCF